MATTAQNLSSDIYAVVTHQLLLFQMQKLITCKTRTGLRQRFVQARVLLPEWLMADDKERLLQVQ